MHVRADSTRTTKSSWLACIKCESGCTAKVIPQQADRLVPEDVRPTTQPGELTWSQLPRAQSCVSPVPGDARNMGVYCSQMSRAKPVDGSRYHEIGVAF